MREIERDREGERKKDTQTNRDFAAGPIVSVSLFIAGFQRERERERAGKKYILYSAKQKYDIIIVGFESHLVKEEQIYM